LDILQIAYLAVRKIHSIHTERDKETWRQGGEER